MFISPIMREPQVALLPPGAAAVYDGRLLHCGTGNASQRPRVQLVLTVRSCGGAVAPASRKTRRAFPGTVTLEELKMGRRMVGMGWRRCGRVPEVLENAFFLPTPCSKGGKFEDEFTSISWNVCVYI